MRHTYSRVGWTAVAAAAASALLLSACGGGSSDQASAPTEDPTHVPASALASSSAFEHYVGSLAPSDTAPPLDLAGLTMPTSETEAPQAL